MALAMAGDRPAARATLQDTLSEGMPAQRRIDSNAYQTHGAAIAEARSLFVRISLFTTSTTPALVSTWRAHVGAAVVWDGTVCAARAWALRGRHAD